ncbi:hypothetical protein ABH935_007189 [Catenulispora sp. GAS73]|uniref:lecithin retinol acyltransferase family protein n=1 Tax=Catenulispora sp. GAS73 TaxID=3156269 RepID=UPI0035139465
MKQNDDLSSASSGRFEPGDHLAVRRIGYMHHGVYISDDRVIQFGGRILDKPNATIGAVTLAEFERDGTARVVEHGKPERFVQQLPEAASSEAIIEAAEWLLANHEPRRNRYNLIGNNCEHMANFCVAGGYTESHQVRWYFRIKAVLGEVLLLYIGYRSRRNRPLTWPLAIFAVAFTALGVIPVFMYNWHIRRFWKHMGPKWRAYQQARARDAQTGEPEST